MTELCHHPYGDEITSTPNDREKFGTYTRDSYTGLDISPNRAYASTYGRFNTADPYMASGSPSDPGSWNRYSYTGGDPINRYDPSGLAYMYPDTGIGRVLTPSVTVSARAGEVRYINVGYQYQSVGENWDPETARIEAQYWADLLRMDVQRQLNQDCKDNVQAAAQTTLASFRKKVAAISTVNDVAGTALTLAVAGTTGYTAAAVAILTGGAVTLPEAVIVGAAAMVATYIAAEVAGLGENVTVDLFVRAITHIGEDLYAQAAAKQTKICDTEYPTWP